ncbi:MAG: hypothetical protein ACXVB9_20620 [Bdellovibrionota bacterium]
MKNHVLVFALLFPLAAHGEHPDRPDHEPHPVLCDQSAVAACVDRERVAGDTARASGHSFDAEISALETPLNEMAKNRAEYSARLGSLQAERDALSSEISFTKLGEAALSPEIMAGFPPAEIFFRLSPLERNWLDRYPQERAQNLISRLQEGKTEIVELRARIQEISSKFDGLNGQYQSLNAQRANLFAAAQQHANMCDGGCRAQLCPPR